MLFNSYVFILCFLPVVIVSYYLLLKLDNKLYSRLLLVLGSLYFYSFWNINYLPLILISILINYVIAIVINRVQRTILKKIYLVAGIVFNISLLGYFKYFDFFIESTNQFFQTNLPLLEIALPLAISFFTFQQIAYIVDSYRGETAHYNFVDYSLFVTFFPQLIAGPIVHHSEMISQFKDKANAKFNSHNFASGLFIFSIGLAKKVLIADTFAQYANDGYSNLASLTVVDSWITTLAYTLQLYFDFSGYCDMAIGLALLFNFRIPVNFNSPYKSLNIQEFWRRWHITLGRFFTQYVYIPLGGSKKGPVRTYINLFLIFFISGFWHGAGWTFIVWGVMHGVASIIYRAWSKGKVRLPKVIAWGITFLFVHVAWVYFRAPDLSTANLMVSNMFNVRALDLPPGISAALSNLLNMNFQSADYFFNLTIVLYLAIGYVIVFFTRNSIERLNTFEPNVRTGIAASVFFVISLLYLTRVSEFIYFNF
ncbi:MBOAT family O-acyltransferase [Jeotgalibacillus aurantiacus]|uniref:MBOAT family O-acyltransferase n=1 Tax=Jeotgalibacillus aurantiacus TaxID=2763266 RepID=UPI001D0ADF25|nr:MBOAT family protein [Jeotgalibacillus aurantiacus]